MTTNAIKGTYDQNGYVILAADILANVDLDKLKEDVKSKYDWGSGRLQDAWQFSDEVKKIACNSLVLETLETLYDRKPVPFQTLNFINGTEQKTHSDSIHFSSLPARFMCGVWVALEDIGPDQGPLMYYPRSHKETELNYQDIGIDHISGDYSWTNPDLVAKYRRYEEEIDKISQKYERKLMTVPKGTWLIWSSNLLHGGSPINNKGLSRWSQVTHYYFEDTVSITPMFSNMHKEEYYIRNPINILTGANKGNTLNGQPVRFEPADFGRHKIVIDESLPVFNVMRSQTYLERYPDVRNSPYGTDIGAYNHFLQFGINEGREY